MQCVLDGLRRYKERVSKTSKREGEEETEETHEGEANGRTGRSCRRCSSVACSNEANKSVNGPTSSWTLYRASFLRISSSLALPSDRKLLSFDTILP